MNHFPYVHEFLRSDTEIGPFTSIVLGGKGRAGGDGGEFVAIAGGIGINESRQVRFWTIVFFAQTGKKQFLDVVSVPCADHKTQEIGDLQLKAHNLVKTFLGVGSEGRKLR